MAIIATGGMPSIYVPAAHRNGTPTLAALGTTLLDATNEACIMIGQIYTADGASHTIDTTGSSSLGWRSAALTFANAGTTVKVGLAAVNTTAGPAVRAVNVADVITFDVSKSLTGGGGGITANAWQQHVPDSGSKTIANGDLVAFCVQMTARAGVDAVRPSHASALAVTAYPAVTQFIGAAYGDGQFLPNAIITFSDGVLGYFRGGHIASIGSTLQTWNNSSSPNEYGNFFQFPFPVRINGIITSCNITGDVSFNLYSAPLSVSPVAERTVAIDLNTIGTASQNAVVDVLFSSPYDAAANQPLAAIITPTTATNVGSTYKSLDAAAHQAAEMLGSNCYAINRASGAFAAQNSNKDRFSIGLMIGAFEHGVQPIYSAGI